MLKEFLTPEAKERSNTLFNLINKFFLLLFIYLVSRLSLVKPEKARKIEDLIIQVKNNFLLFYRVLRQEESLQN